MKIYPSVLKCLSFFYVFINLVYKRIFSYGRTYIEWWMVISIFVVPLNWLHKCQKEKRLVNFAWYSGFKWRPSQIWKSKGIWALRNLHIEWMTNGTRFEKIQHLSVMVGFKMDAKTLFERLFEFMLLNENWMKWDNWLFVCCALGDPIIAGLYWTSCKLLIVIQFLHQARNQ